MPKRRRIKQRSDVRLAQEITLSIVNRLDSVQSILDIGCGDGVVQDFINERISYSGIDVVGACIYPVSNSRDVQYVPGDKLFDVLEKERKRDCVLLLDVIEHEESFVGLAGKAADIANNYIVISVPNELFFLDRLRFLGGKELPAHSLTLVDLPKGFKHQYIVDTRKAEDILVKYLDKRGFILDEIYDRELTPKNYLLTPAMRLMSRLTSYRWWSMGTVFVFKRER